MSVWTYNIIKDCVSDYCVIDFETTGFNKYNDDIIEIGIIKVKNNKPVSSYNQLIKPKRTISNRITTLTNISNNDVYNAPYIEEVIDDVLRYIDNSVLVAHNASFDMGFLLENVRHAQLCIPYCFNVIDTLSLSRQHIIDIPNHKLETIKDYFGLTARSHNALEDCRVTGYLYEYLKKLIH